MQGSWDEAARVDLKRFPECDWGDWRLPTSVKPDQYELELFTTLQVRQETPEAHFKAPGARRALQVTCLMSLDGYL